MDNEIGKLSDKLAHAPDHIRSMVLRNFTIELVQRNAGMDQNQNGDEQNGASDEAEVIETGEVRQSGVVAASEFAGGRKFTKRDQVKTKSARTTGSLAERGTPEPLLGNVRTRTVGSVADDSTEEWDYSQIDPLIEEAIDEAIDRFWKEA